MSEKPLNETPKSRQTMKRIDFHRLCQFLESRKVEVEAMDSFTEVHDFVEQETPIRCATSAIQEACEDLEILPISRKKDKRMEELEFHFVTLNQQVNELDAQLQQLLQRLTQIDKKTNDHSNTLHELNTWATNTETELGNLKEGLADLDARHTRLREEQGNRLGRDPRGVHSLPGS